MSMTARLFRLLPVLLCALLIRAVGVEPVAAQDWEVRRDPFDRRVIARYKRLLAQKPFDRAALTALRRLYKRHRNIELLIREYSAELERKPDDLAAAVVLARLAEEEGDAAQAQARYEEASKRHPGQVEVHLALAGLHQRAGRAAEARAAYERILPQLGSGPRSKPVLRALGDLCLAQGDLDAARRHFTAYLALAPGDLDARLAFGDALLKHERAGDAVEVFKEAESAARGDPQRRIEIVTRLAGAYEASAQEAQALAEYRRALELSGRNSYLRNELTTRIIDIHRRRQELPVLTEQMERQWAEARRGHFEWNTLARLYEETGHQERAIGAYRKAVARAPHELDTQRRLIKLLENAGREEEALRQYEAAVRIAPHEARFQLELAERYWRRGDEQKALATLSRIAGRFAGDAAVQAALADLYARWGKTELALESHRRLVQLEPEETTHLVNLGEQYFQRNQRSKALAVWNRIVQHKTGGNYARLGEVLAEHDLLAEAHAAFTSAIKLAPADPALYRGRAAVYERQRRWIEAVSDWERVLELTDASVAANKPARQEARRRVVALLKRAGYRSLSARVALWDKAFSASPPDLDAGYLLVEAYLRDAHTGRARAILEKLLAADPQDQDAMHLLVTVYKQQRETDRAVDLLLKLAALSPGRERDYYNEVAELKTGQNRDEEAIYYARKALETSPNDPLAYHHLAERYEDMQQIELAMTAYEKAIALDPRNTKACFALARLYKNSYRLDEALALYHELLRRSNDDETVHKAGRKAIDLAEATGKLGAVEQVVAPLAFTFAHKEVYRRILVELYDRYVPRLLADKLRGDPRAAEELARLGTHGLKPLLEALADDGDVSQQRIAVAVLGYLGNTGAAQPLLRLAAQTPAENRQRPGGVSSLLPVLDWDVRVDALVAAGRLGDPRIIPALSELIEHREVAMREAAAFALGRTADRRAAAPLASALDDRRDSVQVLACLGLAAVGTRPVDPLLAALADPGRSDTARAACAFALGVLGDRRAVPVLIEVLAQGNDEAQRLAAWSLGKLEDRRALPALLGAFFAKRAAVRDATAWALQRVAGVRPAGEAPAAPWTGLLDYPMRHGKFDAEAAVRALPGPLPAPELVPRLIAGHESDIASGIKSAIGRHRDHIVRVLRDLDARDGGIALGPLTTGLDRAPAAQQEPTRQALERIGSALLPQLEPLGQHRDPEVRALAVSVLAKIGAPAARATLQTALHDRSIAVRQAAMRAGAHYALRRPQDAPGLVAEVVARLQAPAWQERVAAAAALGHYGPHGDSAALVRALSDPQSFVREAAAAALGQLGAQSAVPALLQATSDPSVHVRVAAVRSLISIGDPRAHDRLQELRRSTSEDSRVRSAAQRWSPAR
jgi:tetratricopeptide (TPR) repeat protein